MNNHFLMRVKAKKILRDYLVKYRKDSNIEEMLDQWMNYPVFKGLSFTIDDFASQGVDLSKLLKFWWDEK